MPDIPDFEQLADRIVPPPSTIDAGLRRTLIGMIVEHLTLVWNARGDADANAVDDRLATLTGWVTSDPYRQHLRDAIAALDR